MRFCTISNESAAINDRWQSDWYIFPTLEPSPSILSCKISEETTSFGQSILAKDISMDAIWEVYSRLASGLFMLPTSRVVPLIETTYKGHEGSPNLPLCFPLLCSSSLWALYQMVTWNESTGFGKHSISCANTFMLCASSVLVYFVTKHFLFYIGHTDRLHSGIGLFLLHEHFMGPTVHWIKKNVLWRPEKVLRSWLERFWR